jgi:hypothetical protein
VRRLFTFGCSFTQYFWPTWADILGKEFDHFENWGKLGGGNQFIFNSIIECSLRNKFTPDDTVVIMWTNVTREDRYIKDNWETHGNVFTTYFYSPEFLHRYFDIKGCFVRDLAVIHAAKNYLENLGVKFIFLSMVPIQNYDQYTIAELDEAQPLFDLYANTLENIRPSVYEKVFNYKWRPQEQDMHPTSIEHLEYLDKVVPEIPISEATRSWARSVENSDNYSTNKPPVRF